MDNYLICVFPKGFPIDGKEDKTLEENAQLLIKVLKKYNHKSIQNNFISKQSIERHNNNYISLAYELTKDYIQHGLITQTFKAERINGPGKTNWSKTIKKHSQVL